MVHAHAHDDMLHAHAYSIHTQACGNAHDDMLQPCARPHDGVLSTGTLSRSNLRSCTGPPTLSSGTLPPTNHLFGGEADRRGAVGMASAGLDRENGGGGGSTWGLSEGELWLKALECIVDVLPWPQDCLAHASGRNGAGEVLGGAGGVQGCKDKGGEDKAGQSAGANTEMGASVAVGCERECGARECEESALGECDAELARECAGECAALVDALVRLCSESKHVESVRQLVLRALAMFTQLYLRAPEHVIGSVVIKVLEALGENGEDTNVLCRRKVAMGVLHEIGGACASKLAAHLDELTGVIASILPHVSPEEQGHLQTFLFLVSTRLEAGDRRSGFIHSLLQPLADQLLHLQPALGPTRLPQALLLTLFLPEPHVAHAQQQQEQQEQSAERQREERARGEVLGLLLTFVAVLRHTQRVHPHDLPPASGKCTC